MPLRQWGILTLALSLILAAWPGTGRAQQDTRPAVRARLQFARAGGIYDPARWRYTSDWFVYPDLFNWLVRWKPGPSPNQLEPDLAERWDVAQDGLSYTFHLRKGVQWNNGYGEVTADDVVFSFRRQMTDPKMTFYEVLKNVTGVEALDRYTARITLKDRDASFLWTVASYRPGFIVPQKAVLQLGDAFVKTPVGSGPFQFVQLTPEGEVVIRANDGYFRGRPSVRQITFVNIDDENTAAAALQRGDVQVIWTRGNPDVVKLLRGDPKIRTVRVVEYDNLFQVEFSSTFKPVQDARVRQAMAYAIDRRVIAAALPGLDEMGNVMRPAQLFGGSNDVPTYPYNPAKGRALLQEAGYANGFPVTFMIQRREPDTTVAQILVAQWQAIGLQVRLDVLDATAAFDVRDKENFDVTIDATARPGDPNLFFWDLFDTASYPPYGSNYLHYNQVDSLIDAGRITLQDAQRAQIYHVLQQKIMTDLPIIPLFYRAYVLAMTDPVVSMTPGAFSMFWGDSITVRR